MEFRRSVTGIPYIQLDDVNRLAFGLKKGSKYGGLVFTGLEVVPVMKKSKGQKKVNIIEKERISFITDFRLSDIKRGLKKSCPILSNEFLKEIRKVLAPHMDKDGYISESEIGSIEEKVVGLEI